MFLLSSWNFSNFSAHAQVPQLLGSPLFNCTIHIILSKSNKSETNQYFFLCDEFSFYLFNAEIHKILQLRYNSKLQKYEKSISG